MFITLVSCYSDAVFRDSCNYGFGGMFIALDVPSTAHYFNEGMNSETGEAHQSLDRLEIGNLYSDDENNCNQLCSFSRCLVFIILYVIA